MILHESGEDLINQSQVLSQETRTIEWGRGSRIHGMVLWSQVELKRGLGKQWVGPRCVIALVGVHRIAKILWHQTSRDTQIIRLGLRGS